MAKPMDVEQLPSSHHVEGDVASKSELQVNVPEARQSLIRKKVGLQMPEMECCTDNNSSSLMAEFYLLSVHSTFCLIWTEVSIALPPTLLDCTDCRNS
jgi:hypothetical protein